MDYDIVIVGGGIAGLSAALTAARAGKRTIIFTGGVPGGELLNIELVDGIPGQEFGIAGFDLCPIAQEQATNAGAELLMDEVTAIVPEGEGWKVTAGKEVTARAVILATGAHVMKFDVPGADEFVGKGVSHCATCDGPLLRGKVALVAGGGDSGLQEALTLAQHCEKVVVAEKSGALHGQPTYREAAEANPKIEILTGHEVVAIEGADKVERVRLRDASGTESEVAAAGVFAFTGLAANSALADGLVDLDENGRVLTDGAMLASARGIFAAGNLRSGNSWRAAGAMGDGASAAISAVRYLDSSAWV